MPQREAGELGVTANLRNVRGAMLLLLLPTTPGTEQLLCRHSPRSSCDSQATEYGVRWSCPQLGLEHDGFSFLQPCKPCMSASPLEPRTYQESNSGNVTAGFCPTLQRKMKKGSVGKAVTELAVDSLALSIPLLISSSIHILGPYLTSNHNNITSCQFPHTTEDVLTSPHLQEVQSPIRPKPILSCVHSSPG